MKFYAYVKDGRGKWKWRRYRTALDALMAASKFPGCVNRRVCWAERPPTEAEYNRLAKW